MIYSINFIYANFESFGTVFQSFIVFRQIHDRKEYLAKFNLKKISKPMLNILMRM
jgi:hypothetical protein